MSPEAYHRLKDELAALRAWPNIEVPDDFMDTHDTHKDYRARRARIRQIEDVLADAAIDEDAPAEAIAEPGMVLTVRYDNTRDTETFILGGLGAGDEDNKIYPLRSPIGRAIAGARAGEQRTFTLPDGTTVGMTLLKAEPATRSVSKRPRRRCTSRTQLHTQERKRQNDKHTAGLDLPAGIRAAAARARLASAIVGCRTA